MDTPKHHFAERQHLVNDDTVLAEDDTTNLQNDGGRSLISVVVPVFNEELCLPEMFSRLRDLKSRMRHKTNFEFVFVNDGSSDMSFEIIKEKAAKNPEIKLINLSRNFGHQVAVTAGVDAASGDYVAIIDADLQDPPELIEDMYEMALDGCDVVYGKRRKRLGESWAKKVSASSFYRLFEAMSDTPIPLDTGDFRLISRQVANVLSTMREKNRFLRGMVPWIGFRSAPLLYDRDERYAGFTKYPTGKMIGLATSAITSFSAKPLLMVVRLGVALLGIGVVASLILLYLKLFTDNVVPGITSILISILVFNGLQIMIIGVVGTYVARLYEEIKDRPLYVVKETINL